MSVDTAKTVYHHGDLRSALVKAGLDLLANRDLEGLSLREVARAAGVSAPSVYRHFPDKQALMAALAMEGLQRLAAAQREAVRGGMNDEEVLAVAGRAYVRFALANPALFRLIFASPIFRSASVEGAVSAGGCFPALASAAGRSDEEATAASMRSYAVVHGLATLMLDGLIAPDDALIDQVIAPLRRKDLPAG